MFKTGLVVCSGCGSIIPTTEERLDMLEIVCPRCSTLIKLKIMKFGLDNAWKTLVSIDVQDEHGGPRRCMKSEHAIDRAKFKMLFKKEASQPC